MLPLWALIFAIAADQAPRLGSPDFSASSIAVEPAQPVEGDIDAIAQLRPVHYYWRVAEFPAKRFGADRAYGLIAQDVAAVRPELVAIDDNGYQTVDYAKLPLLAIQAIGELKAKNDRLAVLADPLQQQNDLLERRLAAIEGAFSRLSAEPDPR